MAVPRMGSFSYLPIHSVFIDLEKIFHQAKKMSSVYKLPSALGKFWSLGFPGGRQFACVYKIHLTEKCIFKYSIGIEFFIKFNFWPNEILYPPAEDQARVGIQ